MHHSLEPTTRPDLAGVIWITGYSGAGKTTIGRKVEARLREAGLPTVFLDGDDLRAIFASHWGYEREQRIELARIYFRLCSHLASQGFTVVISAVAMYRDVFDWVRTNIPRNLQVFLDVPEEERRRRDRATKNIYKDKSDFSSMYDEPQGVDLIMKNVGASAPDEQAQRIVERYLSMTAVDRDMGRRGHWRAYYSQPSAPVEPSPFAESVARNLSASHSLLEIGCGNGRDASFFAAQGHTVTAIDLSEAAILKCQTDHASLGIRFLSGTIGKLSAELGNSFDLAYSRFAFHAMPLEEELEILQAVFEHLRPGGIFHIECRSINDPMAREGEVISPTERIHGHYRRFIVLEELERRLELAGFDITQALEASGLAVFGDQDPVVIRVEATRPR